ncbi:hypothetical protein BaRGS_00022068, partial [Batillaria attramentaria]
MDRVNASGLANDTLLIASSDDLKNFLFLYFIFVMGAILRHLAFLTKLAIPYTVLVFALGMVAGALIPLSANLLIIGPHTQLNIFMPILIFEGAFAMDVYVFRKVFWQALLLAGPGLAKLLLNWDWYWSLLFGAIVSATDPVAVVALLKEIGASQHLSLLIEGESLLNDGTAMVAFYAVYQIMTSTTITGVFGIVKLLVRFAVGGPLFGYFVAYVSLFWLSRTFNDPLSEIAVTILAAYLTFFAAETMLGVSGVLALCVLGIVLSNNRTSISPEVEEFLHSFWEALSYLANTLIFFLVGMTIVQSVINSLKLYDFVYLALIYVSVNAIRGIVIVAFSPIMRRIAYGLPWQYTIVATWSGLRGAVGLAMALIVYHSPHFERKRHITYQARMSRWFVYAEKEGSWYNQAPLLLGILFYLSGIVFISLVVNATTVSKLLALLGMSGISNARKAFLASVDWDFVDQQCAVKDPFQEEMTKEEQEAEIDMTERVWAQCPNCGMDVPYQPTPKELADMTAEAIIRLLKAERLSYWRQFEQGMLATEALRMLIELCDIAADKRSQYLSIDVIKQAWEYPRLTRLSRLTPARIPPRLASCPLKVLTNRWVVTTVALVLYLLVDAPLTTASLAIETKLVEYVNLEAIMIVDTIILILMASYFIARTVVLKQVYVRTPWFWLSIAIIVHGVIDDIVLMTVPSDHLQTPHDGQYTTTEYIRIVSICFRFIRQLHALEAFMPLLIMLLDKSLSKHLSNGYDVGRGFVLGEEEVRNVIELMSDRKEIVDELRNHCDNAKFEILKCLGLLQKKHPEVAMGVKTHRAIRSVLNQLRMGIHTLQQEGVLEEAEGSELQTIIESRMKKLLTAPPKVPLASVEKILRNIPWISDNDKLVQFIKGRARLVNYEYGQEMMKQGDPTTGMSIILSGLVKLELSAPIVGGPGYATRILDFLTSGNVLGEMGVLTGNPRSASVKCETAVQVLELSLKDIQEAFVVFSNIDPPLKIRLWRLGAVRLATGVVMDKPAFQSMTKEQVRMLLECGSVHEIVVEKEGTHFLVNSVTMEVVLLYGTAYDFFSQDRYDGPCYIPPKTVRLYFEYNEGPNPVLFVLPKHYLHTENAAMMAPRASTGLNPESAAQQGPGSERSDMSRLCLSVMNLQPYTGDARKSMSVATTASSYPKRTSGSLFPYQKQRRISPGPLSQSATHTSRSLNVVSTLASNLINEESPPGSVDMQRLKTPAHACESFPMRDVSSSSSSASSMITSLSPTSASRVSVSERQNKLSQLFLTGRLGSPDATGSDRILPDVSKSSTMPPDITKSSKMPSDEPGSSNVLPDQPGSGRTPQDKPGDSKILPKEPGSSKMPPVRPDSSKVPPGEPESYRMPLDIPSSNKMPSEEPGSSKIPQDKPGISKMTSEEPGSSKMPPEQPGTSKIPPEEPGTSKIPPEEPGSSKIPPEEPGSGKMPPEEPGTSNIPPEEPGSSKMLGPSECLKEDTRKHSLKVPEYQMPVQKSGSYGGYESELSGGWQVLLSHIPLGHITRNSTSAGAQSTDACDTPAARPNPRRSASSSTLLSTRNDSDASRHIMSLGPGGLLPRQVHRRGQESSKDKEKKTTACKGKLSDADAHVLGSTLAFKTSQTLLAGHPAPPVSSPDLIKPSSSVSASSVRSAPSETASSFTYTQPLTKSTRNSAHCPKTSASDSLHVSKVSSSTSISLTASGPKPQKPISDSSKGTSVVIARPPLLPDTDNYVPSSITLGTETPNASSKGCPDTLPDRDHPGVSDGETRQLSCSALIEPHHHLACSLPETEHPRGLSDKCTPAFVGRQGPAGELSSETMPPAKTVESFETEAPGRPGTLHKQPIISSKYLPQEPKREADSACLSGETLEKTEALSAVLVPPDDISERTMSSTTSLFSSSASFGKAAAESGQSVSLSTDSAVTAAQILAPKAAVQDGMSSTGFVILQSPSNTSLATPCTTSSSSSSTFWKEAVKSETDLLQSRGLAVQPSAPDTSERVQPSAPDTSECVQLSAPDTSERVQLSALDTGERVHLSAPDTVQRAHLSAPDTVQRAHLSAYDTGERVQLSAPDTDERVQPSAPDTVQRAHLSAHDTGERVQLSPLDTGERVQLSARDTGERVQLSPLDTGERVQLSASDTGEHVQLSASDTGERVQVSASDTGDSHVGQGTSKQIAGVERGKSLSSTSTDSARTGQPDKRLKRPRTAKPQATRSQDHTSTERSTTADKSGVETTDISQQRPPAPEAEGMHDSVSAAVQCVPADTPKINTTEVAQQEVAPVSAEIFDGKASTHVVTPQEDIICVDLTKERPAHELKQDVVATAHSDTSLGFPTGEVSLEERPSPRTPSSCGSSVDKSPVSSKSERSHDAPEPTASSFQGQSLQTSSTDAAFSTDGGVPSVPHAPADRQRGKRALVSTMHFTKEPGVVEKSASGTSIGKRVHFREQHVVREPDLRNQKSSQDSIRRRAFSPQCSPHSSGSSFLAQLGRSSISSVDEEYNSTPAVHCPRQKSLPRAPASPSSGTARSACKSGTILQQAPAPDVTSGRQSSAEVIGRFSVTSVGSVSSLQNMTVTQSPGRPVEHIGRFSITSLDSIPSRSPSLQKLNVTKSSERPAERSRRSSVSSVDSFTSGTRSPRKRSVIESSGSQVELVGRFSVSSVDETLSRRCSFERSVRQPSDGPPELIGRFSVCSVDEEPNSIHSPVALPEEQDTARKVSKGEEIVTVPSRSLQADSPTPPAGNVYNQQPDISPSYTLPLSSSPSANNAGVSSQKLSARQAYLEPISEGSQISTDDIYHVLSTTNTGARVQESNISGPVNALERSAQSSQAREDLQESDVPKKASRRKGSLRAADSEKGDDGDSGGRAPPKDTGLRSSRFTPKERKQSDSQMPEAVSVRTESDPQVPEAISVRTEPDSQMPETKTAERKQSDSQMLEAVPVKKESDSQMPGTKTAERKESDSRMPDSQMSEVVLVRMESDSQMPETKTTERKHSDPQMSKAVSMTKESDSKMSERKTVEKKQSDSQMSDTQKTERKVKDSQMMEAVSVRKESDSHMSEVETVEKKQSDSQTPETKSAERKESDSQMSETKMVEKKQTDSQMSEIKTTETMHSDPQMSEAVSARKESDSKISESKTVEKKQTDSKMSETERKQSDSQMSEAVPVRKQSDSHMSEAVPVRKQSDSQMSEAVPVRKQSDSQMSEAVPVRKQSDSQMSEAVPVRKQSDSQMSEAVPVRKESDSQMSEAVPVRKQSDSQMSEAVPVRKESDSQMSEAAPVRKQSDSQMSEAVPVRKESDSQMPGTKTTEKKQPDSLKPEAVLVGKESDSQMPGTNTTEKKHSDWQMSETKTIEKKQSDSRISEAVSAGKESDPQMSEAAKTATEARGESDPQTLGAKTQGPEEDSLSAEVEKLLYEISTAREDEDRSTAPKPDDINLTPAASRTTTDRDGGSPSEKQTSRRPCKVHGDRVVGSKKKKSGSRASEAKMTASKRKQSDSQRSRSKTAASTKESDPQTSGAKTQSVEEDSLCAEVETLLLEICQESSKPRKPGCVGHTGAGRLLEQENLHDSRGSTTSHSVQVDQPF